MFLRAGMVSLIFLLASRVLGLLRESGLAGAFGATAAGDLAVLMLSLPDWVAGVLASGALAYVLLPAWARHAPAQVAAAQRRVALRLLAAGLALAVAAVLLQGAVLRALVPGLPADLQAEGRQALFWNALAIPPALLAALWATRLQHEKDFAGLYGGNIAFNLVIVAALAGLAATAGGNATMAILGLGIALLAAMGARAAWQLLRLRRFRAAAVSPPIPSVPLPSFPLWAWAIASAGLPLALPFVARSLASHEGAGALATFNYAWKLVELPLLLAVQLVATLALGPIAQAWSTVPPAPDAAAVVRRALALAWTLACASAAGIAVAAPALAQLLFGWGRMDEAALAHMAAWARIGSWGLLPQALTAVGLAVLAAQSRMRAAALAHAVALGLLLLGGAHDGAGLMLWLNALSAGISLAVLAAAGRAVFTWLPWRALASAGGVLLLVHLAVSAAWLSGVPAQLAAGAAAAAAVLLAAWAASPDVRMALRR
ncbi:hypothetical protein FN976_21370 [Caenimonas sedimenti]|uniref:Virulence factor MviN n=1 Tax=Caenimonas sedimenti TaxID=2596921 RepID=A0A562ZKT0_9BURK|nr:lipid II flippase MurJ [Caenimonas sedimenti]TWO68946.1 hypothetical protein FN976_21370 [Caenimonas sedimenti]